MLGAACAACAAWALANGRTECVGTSLVAGVLFVVSHEINRGLDEMERQTSAHFQYTPLAGS